MNNLIRSTNHPLIPREQTYTVDRKLVTVHTEDRDINQWPEPNHFEVSIPETLLNVESIRLVEIMLPANYYTFSNRNQNTKFWVTCGPFTNEIIIGEGFYNDPEELAAEITGAMNAVSWDPGVVFIVTYNRVSQKFWFSETSGVSFTLDFERESEYDLSCNTHDKIVFDNYTKWGLPWYLGFDKETYTSSQATSAIVFHYDGTSAVGANKYYVTAPATLNVLGESAIYMELDKYNSMDEIKPYSISTNNLYNNDYNGRVNSAFAKIPVVATPHAQFFDSRNAFLQNVAHYNPPIEKIKKLKFKFRYHDGRLVDFQNSNFNFTIAFNLLQNEQLRDYTVNIPNTYFMT